MLLVCYVLLYVVALCVKMRYVILSIKRLLIDWGLGGDGAEIPSLCRSLVHFMRQLSFVNRTPYSVTIEWKKTSSIGCVTWATLKLISRSMVGCMDGSHTHPCAFNGPFSGTTQVSQYRKGKTNLDFIEARDSEWQWHQLGHMQVCTSLQTDNYTSTPPLSFYRPDARPVAQPTASKHWRHTTHTEYTKMSDFDSE